MSFRAKQADFSPAFGLPNASACVVEESLFSYLGQCKERGNRDPQRGVRIFRARVRGLHAVRLGAAQRKSDPAFPLRRCRGAACCALLRLVSKRASTKAMSSTKTWKRTPKSEVRPAARHNHFGRRDGLPAVSKRRPLPLRVLRRIVRRRLSPRTLQFVIPRVPYQVLPSRN